MRVQIAFVAGFLLLGACGPFGLSEREDVETPEAPAAAAPVTSPAHVAEPEHVERDAGAANADSDAGVAAAGDAGPADAGADDAAKVEQDCLLILCVKH